MHNIHKRDSLERIAKNASPTTIVVVAAHDDVVIEALSSARKYAKLNLILIGQKSNIELLIKEFILDGNIQIIDEPDLVKASELAVELVRENKAHLIMKGLVDTKILLKAVVDKEKGIRTNKILSHVALFYYPHKNKTLIASDCAMTPEPSVQDKIAIINNCLEVGKKIGIENFRVGLVSCVEKVNPRIKSTVDAVEVVEHFKNNPINNCFVEGPFAVDNLVSTEASKHKGIASNVAGNANVLIFPTLDAGNVFYKTSVFLADAEVAGILVGAKVPIILTSRADSSDAKLESILLGVALKNEF